MASPAAWFGALLLLTKPWLGIAFQHAFVVGLHKSLDPEVHETFFEYFVERINLDPFLFLTNAKLSDQIIQKTDQLGI